MDLLNWFKWRLEAAQGTRQPLAVVADSLRLRRSPYTATSKGGDRLGLRGGRGEWFTFYENLVRRDYFKGLSPLREGDVVVDVGANIGAFSVVAARQVGASGRVIAYEPDPDICRRLRDNIELNGLTNVTVHNRAVGGKSGTATFFRHDKDALSSLYARVDGREPRHASEFDVDVVGFPDVIGDVGAKVALLKVDCEGAEYEMFGALDRDAACRISAISMEVHEIPGADPEALIRRLQWLGFRVSRGYPLTAVRPMDS
jgi:FkbM family methyltransferase